MDIIKEDRNVTLTPKVRELLHAVRTKVPPEKRREVMEKLRHRLGSIDVESTMEGALIGAVIGAICEVLPLSKLTGIDDFVEVGAAIGAYAGHLRERRKRGDRQDLLAVVEEELLDAEAA
jgi:hypothetical protein